MEEKSNPLKNVDNSVSPRSFSSKNRSVISTTPQKRIKRSLKLNTIKEIIRDAFIEFKDRTLSEEKLVEYVDEVCQDSFWVAPDDVAKRILAIMESVQVADNKSSFSSSIYSNRQSYTPIKKIGSLTKISTT